jgi:hypothetical protein
MLGCIFLQESSGFLCFPFPWRFFHRNHDSCSAVTFSERHQACLYGAYVESYIGYQFVRQKQRVRYNSMVLYDGFCPPLSLRRLHHCCAAIAALPPPLPPPLLCHHCHCHRCAAIAIAVPPKPLLHRHCRCCAAIVIAAPPPSLPSLRPSLHCHCCTAMMETGDDDNGDNDGDDNQ